MLTNNVDVLRHKFGAATIAYRSFFFVSVHSRLEITYKMQAIGNLQYYNVVAMICLNILHNILK